jgi:hypothetical protein
LCRREQYATFDRRSVEQFKLASGTIAFTLINLLIDNRSKVEHLMFGLFKKSDNIEEIISDSVTEVQPTNDAHTQAWRLGEEQSWSIDLNHGQILFSFADGTMALAPVQIVGTFNAENDSFMWGWSQTSLLPEVQKNAALVKAFGKKHRSTEFTRKKVYCSEQRAWEYTALAMRLGQAKGAYRAATNDNTFVYMNFGEVQLTSDTHKHWSNAIQSK